MKKNIITREIWSVIGLSLLVSSVLLYVMPIFLNIDSSSAWSELSKTLASTLFSVAIVVLVQENLIKRRLFDSLINFQENGFSNFYTTRNMDIIKANVLKSKKSLLISSVSFYVPMSAWKEELFLLLKNTKNIKIHILILDPESDAMNLWEKNVNIHAGTMKVEVANIISFTKEIIERCKKENITGEIELKTHSILPFNSMYVIDDKVIYYNPYIYRSGGAKTPCFKLLNSANLFDVYTESIENIWESKSSQSVVKYTRLKDEE